MAGADGEQGDGWAAQQLILPPQWQQAWAGCLAHAGSVGAASNCDHTSKKLNKIAVNRPFKTPWQPG